VFLCRYTDGKCWIYLIPRNNEVIEFLLAKTREVFEKLSAGWVPLPSTSDEASREYRTCIERKTVVADIRIENAIAHLKAEKEKKNQTEYRIDKIETFLKNTMQDAEAIISEPLLDENGNPLLSKKGEPVTQTLATWKLSARTAIDQTALKKELPDVYKKYIKTTESKTLRLR